MGYICALGGVCAHTYVWPYVRGSSLSACMQVVGRLLLSVAPTLAPCPHQLSSGQPVSRVQQERMTFYKCSFGTVSIQEHRNISQFQGALIPVAQPVLINTRQRAKCSAVSAPQFSRTQLCSLCRVQTLEKADPFLPHPFLVRAVTTLSLFCFWSCWG